MRRVAGSDRGGWNGWREKRKADAGRKSVMRRKQHVGVKQKKGTEHSLV